MCSSSGNTGIMVVPSNLTLGWGLDFKIGSTAMALLQDKECLETLGRAAFLRTPEWRRPDHLVNQHQHHTNYRSDCFKLVFSSANLMLWAATSQSEGCIHVLSLSSRTLELWNWILNYTGQTVAFFCMRAVIAAATTPHLAPMNCFCYIASFYPMCRLKLIMFGSRWPFPLAISICFSFQASFFQYFTLQIGFHTVTSVCWH